jgi:hypothetical protein
MNSYSAGQRTCRYMDPLRCTKIDMAAVCFCERVSPRVVGYAGFAHAAVLWLPFSSGLLP